ncbi:hypothetical protein ACJX0J_038018 [Zea mays]
MFIATHNKPFIKGHIINIITQVTILTHIGLKRQRMARVTMYVGDGSGVPFGVPCMVEILQFLGFLLIRYGASYQQQERTDNAPQHHEQTSSNDPDQWKANGWCTLMGWTSIFLGITWSPHMFVNRDAALVLSYSVILLNTDQHNQGAGRWVDLMWSSYPFLDHDMFSHEEVLTGCIDGFLMATEAVFTIATIQPTTTVKNPRMAAQLKLKKTNWIHKVRWYTVIFLMEVSESSFQNWKSLFIMNYGLNYFVFVPHGPAAFPIVENFQICQSSNAMFARNCSLVRCGSVVKNEI